jgi:hypothetical protein
VNWNSIEVAQKIRYSNSYDFRSFTRQFEFKNEDNGIPKTLGCIITTRFSNLIVNEANSDESPSSTNSSTVIYNGSQSVSKSKLIPNLNWLSSLIAETIEIQINRIHHHRLKRVFCFPNNFRAWYTAAHFLLPATCFLTCCLLFIVGVNSTLKKKIWRSHPRSNGLSYVEIKKLCLFICTA